MSLDRERQRRNPEEFRRVIPYLLAAGVAGYLAIGAALWYASKPRESPERPVRETEIVRVETEEEIKERESKNRWKAWGSGVIVGSGAVLGIGGAAIYLWRRIFRGLSQ